jgi:ABC-type transport system involved in multi-copper enzyme maturation permease subunit
MAVIEIAQLTVRDLLRRRVLVLLALFCGGMVAVSFPLRVLSIGQWQRIITDVGLGATDLSVSLLAMLLGSSLIAGDLEKRSLYPLLAKPVSRGSFVAGKYLGLMVIVGLMTAAMGVGTLGVLAAARESGFVPIVQGVLGIIFSGAVMGGIALMFSCFTSATLAGIFSLSIALAGHLSSDLAYFGSKTPILLPRLFMIGFAKILPHLEALNLKDYASAGTILPSSDVLLRIGYGTAYSILVVSLGAVIFSRRDLK